MLFYWKWYVRLRICDVWFLFYRRGIEIVSVVGVIFISVKLKGDIVFIKLRNKWYWIIKFCMFIYSNWNKRVLESEFIVGEWCLEKKREVYSICYFFYVLILGFF